MRCVGRVRESCQRHDIACVCCGSRERERGLRIRMMWEKREGGGASRVQPGRYSLILIEFKEILRVSVSEIEVLVRSQPRTNFSKSLNFCFHSSPSLVLPASQAKHSNSASQHSRHAKDPSNIEFAHTFPFIAFDSQLPTCGCK